MIIFFSITVNEVLYKRIFLEQIINLFTPKTKLWIFFVI